MRFDFKDDGVFLLDAVEGIVNGPLELDEKLQSICNLLKEGVDHYDWVGFYLPDKEDGRMLHLGPYAGAETEHTQIPFGMGVCGQVAESAKTMVVQDVRSEGNYLSCSIDVRSEIVVPILRDEKFIGELDIDSHLVSPFGDGDETFLRNVSKMVGAILE